MSKGLEQRARALEGEFFARQEEHLIEELRERARRERLDRASGIHDAEQLDFLLHQGIRPETLVALLLAPLVRIAWANGYVTAIERNALHAELRAIGIRPESPAGALLERWLERSPPAGLTDAWRACVAGLREQLEPERFAEVAAQVAGLCRAVADSDGGVLRVGRRISEAETGVIEEVERELGLD
ncbi:MAG: hypothetical protein QNK03_15180 [Myxococcota bacterium]|nr:hypothetical protein [Myxococcota bacterium]